MPNAHSHAFQRAMAGNTEYRLSARDSFWTWRRAMYALANRIEPDDLADSRDAALHRDAQERLHLGRGVSLPAPPAGRRPYAGAESSLGGHRRRRVRRGHRPHLPADSVPVQRFRRPAVEARTGALRFGHGGLSARRRRSRRRRTPQRPSGRGVRGRARTGAAFHSLRAVPLEHLARGNAAACDKSTPTCPCTFMWRSKCWK